MTREQIEVLANELRAQLRVSTCCAPHASAVCLHALAGFALDDANDNAQEAARTLVLAAKAIACDLRAGKFRVMRMLQS